MNSYRDNGGPAFPDDVFDSSRQHGMTLRDYLAASALAGGLEQGVEHDMAGLSPDAANWWHPAKKIASRAYAIADAMLAERAK